MPVDQTAGASTPAVTIRPYSSPNVILAAVPAGSTLPRPVQFGDYSTQFSIINPATSNLELFGLSLYNYRKEYPTPADVGEMENDVLPGLYQVQYPTVANPSARTGIFLAHRLVPNGTLTIGTYKKPTWLLRSAATIERLNEDPVQQTWVNGRLRFDPELPTTFTWDDLVTDGFASGLDQMTISIEDPVTSGTLTAVGATSVTDDGADFFTNLTAGSLYTLEITSGTVSGLVVEVGSWTGDILNTTGDLAASGVIVGDTYRLTRNDPIWPLTGAAVVVSILNPQATLLMQGVLDDLDLSSGPDSRNAFMVFQYSRIITTGATGDVSTVTLRVPIEMMRSYASYRKTTFPGAAGLNDSISGPNADPDGDGLTNLQEFNQGGNPTVPTFAVSNPSIVHPDSSNPDPNAPDIPYDAALGVPFPYDVTLGGTVESDLTSPNNNVIIYERGVVYAPSSTNPFPMIDWPGVIRQTDGADVALWDQSDPNEVDTDEDGWRDVVELAAVPPTDPLDPLAPYPSDPADVFWTLLPDGNRVAVKSTATSGLASGIGDFTVDEILGLTAETQYTFRPYAITNLGVVYSSQISTFTTAPLPIFTVPTVASPTSIVVTGFAGIYSATLGGNVTSDGGSSITERGVVYSLTSQNDNPVIDSAGVTKLIAGGTTGVFTVPATGLARDTTYSFRAYATSAVGTSYTSTIGSFTTPSGLAEIMTPSFIDITLSSATLGGDVTNNGGLSVLQRGVLLSSTDNDPELGGVGVIAFAATSTGTGVFTVNTTVLPGTTYFFKAYAFNLAGISYTAAETFTTLSPLTTSSPTAPIANITATMAVLGGTVESDQGTTATGRGVVYSSTNMDPQIGDDDATVLASGTGTMGSFTVDVGSLTPDTLYYYRGYATNSAGTNYSVVSSFSTLPLAILGLTQVELVPESLSGLAFAVIEGSEQPQPRLVPRFVYQKSAAEMADPLNYQIKISPDTTNWLAVDQNEWTVEEDTDGLTVTWASTESPPANLFFRVEVTAAN